MNMGRAFFSGVLDWDEKTFLVIHGWSRPVLDYFLGWPTFLGAQAIALPLVLLFLLIWKERRTAWAHFAYITSQVALAAGANRLLKEIVGRPRPWEYFYEARDRGEVALRVLFSMETTNAFPSGHTFFAFALAVVVNRLYGNRFGFLYVLAAWIGLTRIYVGAHFPLDVLGGALFGLTLPVMLEKTLFSLPFFRRIFPCAIDGPELR
ncbi:MAG: phosphatase PAP2 family protein [Candidatus Omnitrophota bacterium]